MSEINKLYENAGIKPTYTDECQMADSYYSMEKDLNERGILFDDYMKQECPNKNEMCYETCPYAYNKEFYPPFTAEKQIELIKWLGKLDGKLEINCTYNKEKFIFSFYFNRKTDKNSDPIYPYSGLLDEDFDILIVKQINELWQDLTPEEKQQVKGILE